MKEQIAGRYERQSGIFNQELLTETTVTIIGTGAIGRQIVLQLAAIGVGRIQLVDFDTVEPENLAAQGFLESDLNLPKVIAIEKLCRNINSEIKIDPSNCRFNHNLNIADIVFCCVDKISAREKIWKTLKYQTRLWIDTRMAAEFFRIFAVQNKNFNYYETQFFNQEQAYQNSCTAKTTIYNANVCAGFAVAIFTKWLRRIPLEKCVSVNLLTMEMSVEE